MPSSATNRTAGSGMLRSTEPRLHVPADLINDVLPSVRSLDEMHVLIAVIRLIPEHGDYADPLSERTLLRDPRLRATMRTEGSPREPDRRITAGLELAVARGTLIRIEAEAGRRSERWYYVRTPETMNTLDLIERGVIPPPAILWPDDEPPQIRIERPNSFRLYEQNIGPLTPLIADQINRAMELYPADWIADAIAESVSYNRRSWRYISRILENWKTHGRQGDSP